MSLEIWKDMLGGRLWYRKVKGTDGQPWQGEETIIYYPGPRGDRMRAGGTRV